MWAGRPILFEIRQIVGVRSRKLLCSIQVSQSAPSQFCKTSRGRFFLLGVQSPKFPNTACGHLLCCPGVSDTKGRKQGKNAPLNINMRFSYTFQPSAVDGTGKRSQGLIRGIIVIVLGSDFQRHKGTNLDRDRQIMIEQNNDFYFQSAAFATNSEPNVMTE